MTNDNFEQYAEIYDLINSSKDYAQEFQYFDPLIKCRKNNNILEIGSGTGNFSNLLAEKYNLTCVELSKCMADICYKKYNIKPIVGHINDIDLKLNSFNGCLALFHVVNYLTKNNELQTFFEKISNALTENGRFVFDIWHTPSVFNIGPSERSITVPTPNGSIIRKSRPEYDIVRNIIDVEFEFSIYRNSREIKCFSENHSMRPFSIPEIKILMSQAGLSAEHIYANKSNNYPSLEVWDVAIVAKKEMSNSNA